MSEQQEPLKIPPFLSLESTLGAITLLAMKSHSHKYLFAADFEWLILPSVSQKQFALFRSKKNEPVAFVSWAKVSEEVEKRLLSGQTKLQPKDWNSGDKLYIIDVISPFAQSQKILKELAANQLKDEKVSVLEPDQNKKGFNSVALDTFLEKNTSSS